MFPLRLDYSLDMRIVVDQNAPAHQSLITGQYHSPGERAAKVMLDPLKLLQDAVLVFRQRRRADPHLVPRLDHLVERLDAAWNRLQVEIESGRAIDDLHVVDQMCRILVLDVKGRPLLDGNIERLGKPR